MSSLSIVCCVLSKREIFTGRLEGSKYGERPKVEGSIEVPISFLDRKWNHSAPVMLSSPPIQGMHRKHSQSFLGTLARAT